MIDKKQFVNIIDRMKATSEFVNDVNDKARELRGKIDVDFFDGNSLFISNNDIVVQLLENIFNDKGEIISWWIFEMNYGRDYKDGYVSDCDGNNIDVSTVEKLYDYLVGEMEN